jgi:mannosyltransferase OCH1-like enzyme
MRRELIEFGKTWERLGYETILWTEATLPELRNQEIYDEIELVGVNTGGGVPELGVWVQRADLVSYELIWQFGGIYANTDMEALRSLDPILRDVEAFAGMEDGEFLSNALMGCVAGHHFFSDLIDELPIRFREMRGEPMNAVTGPHLLSRMQREDPGGLTVFPKKYFNPVLYDGQDMSNEWAEHPDSYCVHHWGHTRDRWTREPDSKFLDERWR